jgi:hypothetical protein
MLSEPQMLNRRATNGLNRGHEARFSTQGLTSGPSRCVGHGLLRVPAPRVQVCCVRQDVAGEVVFDPASSFTPIGAGARWVKIRAKCSLGDAGSSLGDADSSLGNAKSSLGDAESSMGDAESSLGDAERSLGDAECSLG